MDIFPLNTDNAPSLILELIFELKVKDAMSTNLITGNKEDRLKDLQKIMKEKRITGLPITKNRRLLGVVSMDDIIQALEADHINETAENHMTRSLIVLEEDMPLSFAIKYMDKYNFGRFPVLNMEKELVGIVTSKDILNKLLLSINKEMSKLEDQLVHEESDIHNNVTRSYICRKFDFENAGKGSTEIKKLLKERSIDRKIIRRIAVAAYELEINLVVHSNGGSLTFYLDKEKAVIKSQDTGPGINKIEDVLKEGFSTANDWIRSLGFGAGMGLPNIKRVSDEFSIDSDEGKGTTVISTVYIKKRGEDNDS